MPGFALMFVLLAVVFGTSMSMHDERDWGTLSRLLVAPGGFTRILLGKLAARFVVGVVQMLVLLGWGHFVFGVSLGSSPLAIAAAHAGVGLRGGGGRHAGRGPRAARASRPCPLGLSLVMALSALGGLLVAAVDAARLDEPHLAGGLHHLGDARAERPDPARARPRAVLLPAGVLLAYGAATLALGLRLFRVRHSAR